MNIFKDLSKVVQIYQDFTTDFKISARWYEPYQSNIRGYGRLKFGRESLGLEVYVRPQALV